MEILNVMSLKNGAKADYNNSGSTLMQPQQFISEVDKTLQWSAHCMDWLEWQGIKQLKRNATRLLKNYKLAKGHIERSDYIIEENEEHAELLDNLLQEDSSAIELKFYPIIPTVLNVLRAEFSKRISKIQYRAVDELSYNEMLESKKNDVEEVLLQQALSKMTEKFLQMGADLNSDDAKQQLSPENLKTLPEIEQFYKKDYRNIYEEWAFHQHKVDEERFRINELEERGFSDMLITDREFWHFRMLEDDYEMELWNPPQVFYHKSPVSRYISDSQWIGMIDLMTPADVLDRYGWMMDEEQLTSLERLYPVRSAAYLIGGMQNDGSYYDASRSHDWNTQMPSLAMRQYLSRYDNDISNGDIVQQILSEGEDLSDFGNSFLLRVATIYWKSQRKVGHLTKITQEGELIQKVITEDYFVTDKPMYDTTVNKNKTKDNLIYGEHIDWIWINDMWGGVKIGPNRPSFWGANNPSGVNPIYLGINQNEPKRLRFQFKGDISLYGCKPPVEGCVFSDRNTKSISLVDLMKPYQIGYNIVNNQIADILVDELGTVILFDQNALPRHSMGEDWGKANLQNAYLAMKNFQMLPLDTSLANTEAAMNFQHYQVLNLEQTQRLMSRIQLATYFKNQAFESIGITPQRLGQGLSQQDSAKGIEQAVNLSYTQTEMYFVQHSDYLMPRVHQMRTDLAQYYNSNKPSVRLSYVTTNDEKVNFQINGTNLLLRDFNIFCSTKTNSRSVMEQLKQLSINNNTTGASIFDLGNMIKAESLAEMDRILKGIEQKQELAKKQEQEYQQKLQQDTLASQEKQRQDDIKAQAERDDKMIEKDITVAEIRAAGMGATVDINQNQQNDYQDAMENIQKQQNYTDSMNLKREQEVNKNRTNAEKINLQREHLQTQRDIAEKQLQVARENKNKYDNKNNKTK